MGELLVPGADAAARWPFFTEHQSAPALFRTLIVGPLTLVPRELVAEASLKTFKLRVSACALPQQTARLVVAELLRRGDVLADPASKLALFRTLSHEIRTAVQSLKGSLDMWEPKTAADKDVSARMGRSVKRLEKVVGRLEEFRNDLEVEL